MDYKKMYEEAFKRAEQVHKYSSNIAEIKRMENIFPELKESEDKKVKRKIINLIKKSNELGGWPLHKWEADEMLAWIEKQGNNN